MGRSTLDSLALWAVAKPRRSALAKLFCFPYAGGSAAIFRSWAHDLPDSVEVHALQLPGRAGRIAETPFTDLSSLIAAIGPGTAALLDRPFAFFGHSLGAVVAFELARWLRCQHRLLPEQLFVSGRRAPQVPPRDPPNYAKSDADLIASLHEMNGTPPEILGHEELLGLMLPTLRADFQLVETYVHTPDRPLACPITVFAGAADPETEPAHLEAWRTQTCGRFTLHTIGGDHFFLNSHRLDLLRLVGAELAPILAANQLVRASALQALSHNQVTSR
jgi:medium-chain acyl-[acyl-carrier-protein] hydrolase